MADRSPTVVVSHLDITYRVLGSGRRGAPSGQGESPALKRLLARGRPSIGTREVHAVKDVSFVAHHGESIGIIGRNGSGKSTLLRAVAGLIPPTRGRLWVSGEPSLLGVNAVLMNKLSGERNIYIGGQALGLTREQIHERFEDIVEFSGIGDAIYLPMGTYSSGMGARLRFAISTAAAPEVLMIDEALATGDAEFRERSAARIAEIREQAGTVFLVSHSNSNIRQICDRVLWMDQGRLVMDGPTDEVLPQYEATLPKRSKGARRDEPTEPEVEGVDRWGGGNRLEAAAAAALAAYEAPVGGCIVVSTQRMDHARVAAPLAARLGWPLVWTRPRSLPDSARELLTRLRPERVVVVGGEELVAESTLGAIAETVSGPVERVGDDDVARASRELLRSFPRRAGARLHVTPAGSDAQTLALSAVAASAGDDVLVVDPTRADPDTISLLTELAPVPLVLAGNPEEWDQEAVRRLADASGQPVEWHDQIGPLMRVARVHRGRHAGGPVLVAAVTTGVEMLTAVAVSGALRQPLFLVQTKDVPTLVAREIAATEPTSLTLVGGIDAVGPHIRAQLGEVLAGTADHPRGDLPPATSASAATKSDAPTAQS